MNRRGFLDQIIRTSAFAMVLPSALTYSRQWKLSKYDGYLQMIDFQHLKDRIPLVSGYYDCLLDRRTSDMLRVMAIRYYKDKYDPKSKSLPDLA